MNKFEIEKCLEELNEKNCTAFWIIKKDGNHQGGYMSELINNVDNECIQLKQKEIYYTAYYTDIANLMYTY